MKSHLAVVLLCAELCTVGLGKAAAQTSSNSPTSRKSASTSGRTECVVSVGLCVTVPTDWQRIGDIFDDLGFVVAEPHPGAETTTWPQITVASIDVPRQKDGNPPSLDSLVDTVLIPNASFTPAETLQRARLILNGSNAEIVRVRLQESANDAESSEAVALIEGTDGLVYSIALRCAPQDYARLEAVFQKVIHSWRLQPRATRPTAQPVTPSPPKQDSDKK